MLCLLLTSYADLNSSCSQCGGADFIDAVLIDAAGEASNEDPRPPSEGGRGLGREQTDVEGCLREAQRDFDNGVEAYMREDLEVRSSVRSRRCLQSASTG